MTARVQLQVHDVAMRTIGDDPTAPVVVGYDGTRVVLVLDAEHAERLAQLIATGVTDEPDQALWDNTAVQLLAAKAHTAGGFPDPVYVGRRQP